MYMHTRPGAVKRMTNYTVQIVKIPFSRLKSKILSHIEMSMVFHISLSLCLSVSFSLSLSLSPSLLYLRMSFVLTGRASFKDTVGIELEHSEILNNTATITLF